MVLPQKDSAGLTLRSATIAVLLLLVQAFLIQLIGVSDAWYLRIGAEAVPVTAALLLLALLPGVAALSTLLRYRVLSRPEVLTVFFMLAVAAPLMSQGFWRYFLGTVSALPKTSDLAKLDVLPPALWPHGPNLLAGAFGPDLRETWEKNGTIRWSEELILGADPEPVAILENVEAEALSTLRWTFAVGDSAESRILPGIPVYIGLRLRPEALASSSRYFGRLYIDGEPRPVAEVFIGRSDPRPSFRYPQGDFRTGIIGLALPQEMERSITLELGLEGPGKITLSDPIWVDNLALQLIYSGRPYVTRDLYQTLSPAEKVGVVVWPERWISKEGLRFLLTGFVPWSDWWRPAIAWSGFAVLLLAGVFALTSMLRRQWLESERYPVPFAMIPTMLIGGGEGADPRESLWGKPIFWIAFGVTLLWCVLRVWRAFNSDVPDVNISISLKAYLSDPGWGKTWNGVILNVIPTVLGLALLMELNILLSLVLGYLLFRLQFWVGEGYGWAASGDYPHGGRQVLAGYVIYGLMTLFFTRKYLWRVLLDAVRGGRSPDDVMSNRAAAILLLASFGGAWGWSVWVGVDPVGMLACFAFALLLLLIAAKLRAECGLPNTQFGTLGIVTFMLLLGGIPVFGFEAFLFASFMGALVGTVGFVAIPGMQVEWMASGKKMGLRPTHIPIASMLAIVLGLAIGGWVYLGSSYATGAGSFPITGEFGARVNSLKEYNREVAKLNESASAVPEGRPAARFHLSQADFAMVYAATATAAVTVMRQVMAGFWFHPVGVLLGPTEFLGAVWGSLLFAWLARLLVLRFGGAVTVREKLFPAALGIVVGSLAGYAVAILVNAYVFFFTPGATRFAGSF